MVNVIILIIMIVAGIFLQIFLSKKQNKWWGLILPLICLIFSLIAVLSIPAYFHQEELTLQQISSDGTVMEEAVMEHPGIPVENIGTTVLKVIVVFLLYNIPTAILSAIYLTYREKIKTVAAKK